MEPATQKIRKAQHVAVVIPLANEERTLEALCNRLKAVMAEHPNIRVYLVVDLASKDNTLALCKAISVQDDRFTTLFEPANKNVVDAYLAGFRAALGAGHDLVIEMDGGLSHDPAYLPDFIAAYEAGYDCVFGSRFLKSSLLLNVPWKRRILSVIGTRLSNMLLGTRLSDMTSGYEAFSATVLQALLQSDLKSRAHFIQTEIRYLCRNCRQTELGISYQSPSPRVAASSVLNAIQTLFYYFMRRITFRPLSIC